MNLMDVKTKCLDLKNTIYNQEAMLKEHRPDFEIKKLKRYIEQNKRELKGMIFMLRGDNG